MQIAHPSRARASLLASTALAALFAPAALGQTPTCLPGVTATVDPPCAPQGEPVTLTVHNGTPGFLILPSACLWQVVFDGTCGGPVVVAPFCLDVLTFIPPGESRSGVWDQRDQQGNQVPPGTYVFSVADLCCVPFDVCGACVEPPAKYGPESYGTGGLWPRIDTTGGMPSPGNAAFALTCSFGIGGAPGVLLVGTAPADLAFDWGTLLVAPTPPFLALPIQLGGTPGELGTGSLELPLPIPADTALLGATLHFQFLLTDAGAATGLTHTQGLRVTVCGG